ncbi:Nudix hydrolase [Fusarium beomiforme]|uniref:Nudix hydrolase n=1 Tax=Fusarium beomiforme TaxID=44412 RepID=A0A9P5AQB3_9HYPO|nr:Nudix hydrolase [Fusarium beomiforme]
MLPADSLNRSTPANTHLHLVPTNPGPESPKLVRPVGEGSERYVISSDLGFADRKRKQRESELVSNLEDQVLALKDYVRKLEAACGYANLPDFTSTLDQDDNTSLSQTEVDDSQSSAINDVSTMMWRMTLHGTGETSFVGPSGSFCFPLTDHGMKAINNNEQSPTSNQAEESSERTKELLDLFQQHINSIHHFVPPQVIDTLKTPQEALDGELLQVSVLAAASLVDNSLQKQGQSYADRAESIVMRCCRTMPNLVTAQALAILSWRELALENENNAWLYNSMAASLIVHLGLHMWFIHDRYMDKIYSFEFEELEPFERHQLLSEARDHHMNFFRQMGRELELGKNPNPQVILLHMVYNMSFLLIHRPYLREPKNSAAHQLSIRTNMTSAHALVRLIRQYDKEHSMENAPFFAVHCVLTAAVSLLLNATSTNSTIRSQSTHRFRVCVDALEKMQRWQRAKRGLFLLRELAHRWKVVSALPMRYSVPLDMIQEPHVEDDEHDWGMLFANLEEPLNLESIDLSTPTGEWVFHEDETI